MKAAIFAILISIISFQISNAQWVQMSNGMGNLTIVALAHSGNNLYAGTFLNGVYLSTNNGISWTQTALNNVTVWSLTASGSNVFAGSGDQGVYLSTDNGTSWNQTSLNTFTIYSLAVNGNYIFAGTSGGGVYLSTDNGTNWTQTSLSNENIYSFAFTAGNVYAGTGSGVFFSTDNGTSWTQTALNVTVIPIAVKGNNMFAGTFDMGVYLSTNNGTSWTPTSFLNDIVLRSFAVDGNNIIAGTQSLAGVFLSSDNGTTWIQRNEGLGNPQVYALSIFNNYIFAGTAPANGVWRRPLSELTGIQPTSNEIPNKFSISQNYPNPFNPVTKINFSVPNTQNILIKVYDELGKEVGILVNEQLNPGTYEVIWSAQKFSSGVYYYTLTAGNFRQTTKMILLK